MAVKRVLRAERLRRVPTQFSWIDQRLVRDRHVERCSLDAIGLYLVLVTVADAQGLSYYGEASLERRGAKGFCHFREGNLSIRLRFELIFLPGSRNSLIVGIFGE
jgi:hypothetical protein